MSWGERNETQIASQRAAGQALAESIRRDKAALEHFRLLIDAWANAYDAYSEAVRSASSTDLASARAEYTRAEKALYAEARSEA